MDIWEILGIDSTRDPKVIKRAYAARLKKMKPELDPQAFYHLRQAYEEALKQTEDKPGRSALEPLLALRKNQQPVPPSLLGLRTLAVSRADGMDYDLLRKWVNKILHALKHSETLAKHYFQRALQQEGMVNIELKNAFGELLLRRIAAISPLPQQLLAVMDEEYRWTDRVGQVGGRANLHMTYVVKRMLAHRYLQNLVRDAGHRRLGYLDRIAIDVLTNPVDPHRYAWLVRSRGILSRIDYWLDEFESRHPEILQYELPSSTVQWWRRAQGEVYVQGCHAVISLWVALLSMHLLMRGEPDVMLGFLILPVAFLLLVGADYGRFLWILQWRAAFEAGWRRRIQPILIRHTPYRLMWSVLLVACILLGKWFSPLGTVMALTLFYALMSRVVNGYVLWSASAAAYLSLLWVEWQVQLLSVHGSSRDILYYLQAGFVGTVHILGSYLIYLSFVLLYTGMYMFRDSRKSSFSS